MSTKAVAWAFEQEALSPGNKLLLLAMADVASDTGKSFSSCKTLCRMTGFNNEETISTAQNKLCELRLIADTGQRVGNTARIRVFQMHPGACKEKPEADVMALFESPGNTPSNGVLNPPVIHRQSPGNTRVIPRLTETPILKELGTGNMELGTDAKSSMPEEVQAWNAHDELPKVLVVSSKRLTQLRSRRKDPFFVANWRAAIERVCKSDFCLGKTENGWKASFDFFLQPDAVAKIMEGKYDNRNGASRPEIDYSKGF